jgi:Tfp pilus assembly protein PilO
MKENLIVLILVLVLLLGCYYYYNNVIVPQPKRLAELKNQIEEKNKQLLAAQILAEQREGVTRLIKHNLIESRSDSLVEKASVPFLQFLTTAMDNLGIRLVAMSPMDVIEAKDPASEVVREYLQVPYEMRILASYEELGKFLDVLEKSPQLIRVSNFTISNEIDQTSIQDEIVGKPRQHPISLQINALAILKASFRSESG